jgi:membrane protease subunit HflC
MNRSGIVAIVVTGAIALIVLWSSTFIVYPNEQALVLRFGEFVRAANDPGLYFRIPIAEDVVHIDRRVLKVEGDKQPMLTGDQTPIVVDYFARYQIVNPLRFYQTVRTEDTMQKRLTQIITSQLRRVLANQPLSRILTSARSDVMREISAAVDTQVRNFGEDGQGFGIKIIDVRIKRVDLPPENSEKVYQRMQTQRQQEAARLRGEGERNRQTIQAEADKKAVVIVANARMEAAIRRGEGEAEATRIYNEAFGKDPQFFDFFRSLQALETGMPSSTTTYVGPATGDFFRFFGNETGAMGESTGDPITTGQ